MCKKNKLVLISLLVIVAEGTYFSVRYVLLQKLKLPGGIDTVVIHDVKKFKFDRSKGYIIKDSADIHRIYEAIQRDTEFVFDYGSGDIPSYLLYLLNHKKQEEVCYIDVYPGRIEMRASK
jgi:hypothetical protein